MLTYKEWKKLNESFTGTSFNLGVARPATVGGVVGATDISDWVEKSKLIEAKKMKKGIFGKDVPEDEKLGDAELGDEAELDLDDDEDLGDEEEVSLDDDELDDEEDLGDDELDDEEDLGDDEFDDEEDMNMPPSKKGGKKPPFLKSKAMKKVMKDDTCKKCGKKCGKMMTKCSCKMMKKSAKKKMTKEETDWWTSVMGMIGTNPDQKNWDGISVKEDALLPDIDPNALALAQVPQPGDPGYAPQTRIGQM